MRRFSLFDGLPVGDERDDLIMNTVVPENMPAVPSDASVAADTPTVEKPKSKSELREEKVLSGDFTDRELGWTSREYKRTAINGWDYDWQDGWHTTGGYVWDFGTCPNNLWLFRPVYDERTVNYVPELPEEVVTPKETPKVTGVKHLGYVNLDYATPGTPSSSCPPTMSRSLELLWYNSGRSTAKPYYDDDGYTPRKNEEPKSSKPDTPVSPSEIEKPSEPDVPKNEEPAPSKPVVSVSPSEIEKPVNPPVTPDKPSVPVVPKPSVLDGAKPIEKTTPSNITPSSDRSNRNDSVRPTPSKPSVPQGNDSVAITKVNESEEFSKDKSVAGVDRLNGNVRGEFRNTPLQSDSKPVTIGNPISRNVRTGDMSLAIVFGALAMVNAFGLGFYFWKMNKRLED